MITRNLKRTLIFIIVTLLSTLLLFCSYNKAFGVVNWNGGATSEEFNRALDELNKQNENEQQKAANSPSITYQYTFSYDKNNGTGNMDNDIIEAKTQHNTTVQDPGYTFPENGFNPPIFQKFKCWTINDKEYFPGDRIDSLKSLSNNNFSNSTIHVVANYEIDVLALIICLVILLAVILTIWLFYTHSQNNKKLLFAKENLANQKKGKQSSEDLDFDDKMIKYKKLLDKGIITEEEFNKKKKEILDL